MKTERLLVPLGLVAWCLVWSLGVAQSDDSAEPDREDESPALAGPGQVPFEPAPTAEEEVIEEIIVYGRQDEWRLPDLGGDWRREADVPEPRPGRVQVEFLPLYDPEDEAAQGTDLFRMFDAEQRVGKIELFRFRFGGD